MHSRDIEESQNLKVVQLVSQTLQITTESFLKKHSRVFKILTFRSLLPHKEEVTSDSVRNLAAIFGTSY